MRDVSFSLISLTVLGLLVLACSYDDKPEAGSVGADSTGTGSVGADSTGTGSVGADGTGTGSIGASSTTGGDGASVTSGSDGSVVTTGTNGAVTTTGSGTTTTGTTGPTSTTGSGGASSTTSATMGSTTTDGSTGSGGAGTGGATTTGGVVEFGERPCDIYENAGNSCVAAYSMVRALYSEYRGPLYQVRRGASNVQNPYENSTGMGGDLMDIGLTADGFADAAAQDAFCGNEACTVSIIYDQSPMGNDLTRGPAGCFTGAEGTAAEDDYESNAAAHPITVGGHDVYSLFTRAHEGYRKNNAVGTAEGVESQGVYMVADGTHYGSACCFDFGNASRDTCYGQTGIMNAIMMGVGFWGAGEGSGPWMMADFELGVWAGGYHGIFPGMLEFINGQLNPGEDPIVLSGTEIPDDEIVWEQNPSMHYPYVFGALTTEYVDGEGRSHYAIRSGNAQAGNTLVTAYDDWTEIQFVQEGAIILGIGGDNSNFSYGTFYEGAMTEGRPSAATDQAVYANVQAAGYGQ